MTKTLGSSNYFQGNGLYYLKAIIPYIQKIEPTLLVPQSWSTGGGLNDKAKKFGILPDWENNIEGRGHQAKYKGTTMYKFAKLLINELKTLAPRKPRLTPIEKANKEAQKREGNNELLEIKTGVAEDFEELKDRLAKAFNKLPLLVVDDTELEEPETIAPKGFIILTELAEIKERTMIRIEDILQVDELKVEHPYPVSNITTKVRPDITVEESFDEVVEKIRNALEV